MPVPGASITVRSDSMNVWINICTPISTVLSNKTVCCCVCLCVFVWSDILYGHLCDVSMRCQWAKTDGTLLWWWAKCSRLTMMMFLNFMCTLNQSKFAWAIGQSKCAHCEKKEIMRKGKHALRLTDRQTDERREAAADEKQQVKQVYNKIMCLLRIMVVWRLQCIMHKNTQVNIKHSAHPYNNNNNSAHPLYFILYCVHYGICAPLRKCQLF